MVDQKGHARIFARMSICQPITDGSMQPARLLRENACESDTFATSALPSETMDAKTRLLLESPALPLLLRLAWPNVLVMMAQSSTGLIEMWFVARLGTDALAGMALVLPLLVLMQSMSQGAMGGGISSVIARAIGAGDRNRADIAVLHALTISAAIGLFFSCLIIIGGPFLYRALGGSGLSLQAALTYSDVIFGGMTLVWVFNALGNVIRGTGNMWMPGLVMCGGAVLLVPLSPCLIFGWGPFPALGIAGGGVALLIYYAAGTLILGWYVASGRNLARFRLTRLRPGLLKDILAIGAVAAVNTIQINVTIAMTMSFVAAYAGQGAVAGFGTGARLEYLLPPLSFGLGAPLVALVGTNIGAGQIARARQIALIGGLVAFLLTESMGLTAAIWPHAWLTLFSSDPELLAVGTRYLRLVGPFFGFLGLGLSLYFASQGAGRLGWPLMAGLVRMSVAVIGGWLALRSTGSLEWLFAIYSLGIFLYGTVIATSVVTGSWSRP
jgi:putative MATE family efflux protein